ncbi:hypothetical protein [Roseibium sp.]|uniref:hypothetical protein n=1 Tax=Roseibium sp. TaxID=1936156 RepID=UPI003BAD03E3
MLKHSTSLATLFGRSVCPLFLGTALVVAPGVANATDFYVDVDTTETNNAVGGGNEPVTDGDTLTVNEGVTMTIDEDGAGLSVSGVADVVITNNGSIYTTGTADNCGYYGPGAGTCPAGGSAQNASGLRSFGYGDAISVWNATNAIVINNGLIDVGDYDAAATSLFYADNSISINNGVINLNNDSTYGLFTTRSDGATLINNGSIYSYYVSDLRGMRLAAFDSGAASASQADAGKTGHLMVNNGLIRLAKDTSSTGLIGMDLAGYQTAGGVAYRYIADAAMYNYGSIEVIQTPLPGDGTGGIFQASGIRSSAHDVDIYNYGSIYLQSRGFGIEADGSGLELYNYGSIIVDARVTTGGAVTNTTDVVAAGMQSLLDRDLELDISTGTATSSRDSSVRNTIVNAGLIQMNNPLGTGLSAGIWTLGESGHDVYNYGTIRAWNGFSLLLGENGSPNLNSYGNVYLFDGSILVGDILLHYDWRDRTRFHLGDGYNAALRFDVSSNYFVANPIFTFGTENIDTPRTPNQDLITSPNGFALVGNMVYVVDLESYSQQDKATWSLVSMIQDAIDDGTSSRPPAGDYAFSGSAAGLSENWARAFGGWVRDPGDGAVSVGDATTDERDGGYSGYSAGTVIGVNKPERSYFAGVAYSQVSSIDDMDDDTGYSTHSGTLFGGIATTLRERFNLSVTAGVSFNQTDRDIADNRVPDGIDTTTANYASVFLSPSLLVNGPWGSSLRLNYLGGWTKSHSYELSEGEKLEVQNRFSNIFGARFQMAHDVPKISQTFPVRVRYGVEGSYANGQDIDSEVNDVPELPGLFSNYNIFNDYQGLSTPYDDGFTARGFAALDFGPAFIEAGYNTDEQVSVSAGLKFRF